MRFDETAYGNWNYAHPIIGSEEDLKRCRLEDVLSFHRTHYGPGNASLVLSGDFDPAFALGRVSKFFGDIEDLTASYTPDLTEPGLAGSRKAIISDPLAVLPALTLGYQMGPMATDEYYDLTFLSVILVDGDSSRFYRKYVYENNWVTELYAGPDQQIGPQLFRIWAQMQENVDAEKIVEEMNLDLKRIGDEGISDEEMNMARNQLIYRQVSMMSTSSSVGELLGFFHSCLGDASLINRHLDRYLRVSPESIKRSAKRVFQGENYSSMIVVPGAGNE